MILIVLLGAAGCGAGIETGSPARAADQYVGSDACATCHQDAYAAWQRSHHWHAMQPAAESSVADFAQTHSSATFAADDEGISVTTREGTFPIAYSFGVEPLQQFLVDVGEGRLQSLDVAWDTEGDKWFHLQGNDDIPSGDVMHWLQPSHNWNFMCADCHSTGLQKGYDASSKQYATTWAEINVGCEACHGPGSAHIANPSTALVDLREQPTQINACAPCHSRRSQLAEGFAPDRSYFDHYQPSLLDAGLYRPDGQILDEVYVYGSFVQSKMHAQGVRCSDCHEPHSGELRVQGDAVCTQCHNPSGRADFPALKPAEFAAPAHRMHEEEVACVACHMRTETYMVVDPRRDHSFRIPRPDLSVALGVPNACNDCHQDESPAWAADAIEAVHGAPEDHFAPVLASAREGLSIIEPDLTALALDPDAAPIVRATAMSLMATYDRRMSSSALEKGLVDPAPLVRIGAIRGASRWEGERLWRLGKKLLRDPLLAVRVEATSVLMPLLATLEPAEQRQLTAALEEYERVLRHVEDRAEGQTNIAQLRMAENDIPRAEAALEEAIALNPQWVPALINLADLYRASGRDREGGPLLARAVELAPEHGDVLLARALWLVRMNQSDAALPLLKSAWENARQTRFAYVYAIALHDVDESKEALLVLEDALSVRTDRQLIELAISIAREAGIEEKLTEYIEMWR